MRVQIHSRRVWISQQNVQKPTVKTLVEVLAVEMCVELESEQPREMLRRGSRRRDEPAAGPGSRSCGGGRKIAASTPTTFTVVVSSQHVSKSRTWNLANRIMLGGGPATSPALARPT
jgi:hypothetical protein